VAVRTTFTGLGKATLCAAAVDGIKERVKVATEKLARLFKGFLLLRRRDSIVAVASKMSQPPMWVPLGIGMSKI
jgi:hypothetical protein